MKKSREIQISESEWLIMHVLWEKSPLYMGDIVKALAYTPWSRTTIQTMVSRLVTKNVVGTNKTGYAFLYYPLFTAEESLDVYTKFFVERVYKNDAAKLIENLLNGKYLTATEKKELKKLL
jgi:BlaI family transcriptional regulator, penicillinase repressor